MLIIKCQFVGDFHHNSLPAQTGHAPFSIKFQERINGGSENIQGNPQIPPEF